MVLNKLILLEFERNLNVVEVNYNNFNMAANFTEVDVKVNMRELMDGVNFVVKLEQQYKLVNLQVNFLELIEFHLQFKIGIVIELVVILIIRIRYIF